jgi:anti-sigma B factor antagonist
MTTASVECVPGGIRVSGEMTVYTASQIKQSLVDAITGSPAIVQLDLAGVSEFDTAGVQLLLLAHREALVSGRNLKLSAESRIVREVLALCGARGLLTGTPDMEDRP